MKSQLLIVHCTKCGRGQILADGFNAADWSVRKLWRVLHRIGWNPAPLLCRSCACPMDFWEKQRFGDMSDYAQVQRFAVDMRIKYGRVVDKYFNSKEETK